VQARALQALLGLLQLLVHRLALLAQQELLG
jgi:hypothetical protein